MIPLSTRMRPARLEDFVGQEHFMYPGSLFYNSIKNRTFDSAIFFGPSGTGKTTLARIIAREMDGDFHEINASTTGTKELKELIDNARVKFFGLEQKTTYVYIDEFHRWNKLQQDSLLKALEEGVIKFIGSTTENPYFYVYSAILSRSTVFEFKSVTPSEAEKAVRRGFDFMAQDRNEKYEIEDGVFGHIATACAGDVRKAINSVELCVLSAGGENGGKNINLENAKSLTQKSAMRYDKDGDEHYDIISAYQKSMRGSDPDAAIHYLARLLEAGDLISACRRLLVCACEDVGLAYPQIIPIVKAAVDTAMMVGLPEARLPLADAVILVATSPKSNTAYCAINSAMADVEAGRTGPVPRQLQNMHYDGEDNPNKGQFYKYAHDYEHHWVDQQYLPDAIKPRRYYDFGDNKTEQAAKAYRDKLVAEEEE